MVGDDGRGYSRIVLKQLTGAEQIMNISAAAAIQATSAATAEMPVTMLRLNIIDGVGPVLQIAEGYTSRSCRMRFIIQLISVPTRHGRLHGSAPRLTGEGAFTDVYSVMANWGANHGVTVYGHVGADLITLCTVCCAFQ